MLHVTSVVLQACLCLHAAARQGTVLGDGGGEPCRQAPQQQYVDWADPQPLHHTNLNHKLAFEALISERHPQPTPSPSPSLSLSAPFLQQSC